MLNLDFRLKPSPTYLFLSVGLIGMTVAIVLFLPLTGFLKGVLLIGAAGYGLQVISRYGLLAHPHSIKQLKRLSNGEWLLHMKKRVYEGKLNNFSTATSLVSVLSFDLPKQRWPKTCVIFPDSLDKDLYRQLLVMLRLF